jgi:hypothetical protein
MHQSAATMTTKPHMIRLRNSEYQVHQKHLIELMGGPGLFSEMKDPLLKRKEKHSQFNRELRRSSCITQSEASAKRTSGS